MIHGPIDIAEVYAHIQYCIKQNQLREVVQQMLCQHGHRAPRQSIVRIYAPRYHALSLNILQMWDMRRDLAEKSGSLPE